MATREVLIGGEWRTANASSVFRAMNPDTGEEIGAEFPVSERSDIDAAIEAGAAAAEELLDVSGEARASFLERYAERIEARAEELVASANLANLLLARAVARRREIGVRLALGATRSQLIQQLLAESSLLAAVGAVSGLVIAVVALQFISAGQLDIPISPTYDLELSRPVLLFALGLTLVTALVCGLVPALQASRTSLVHFSLRIAY